MSATRFLWQAIGLLAALWLMACQPPLRAAADSHLTASVAYVQQLDIDALTCRRRIDAALKKPAMPGALLEPQQRAALFARALAEPVLFLRQPATAQNQPLRFAARHRHAPAKLRTLLREGYLYSEQPRVAMALVRQLTLAKLFDADRIFLQRGSTTHELVRARKARRFRYEQSDGQTANLLLFDRVATTREALAAPLHRDVQWLRQQWGFDRLVPLHLTASTAVVRLRFDRRWVRALLQPEAATSPKLVLACLDASRSVRAELAQHRRDGASHRRSVARLQQATAAMIAERLPFDRPRGVKDHFSDGQLRPQWRAAFMRGQHGFTHEDNHYAVFDRHGRPHPPQMCVELTSSDRCSGHR